MKIKSDNRKQIDWSRYKPDFSSFDNFINTWLGASTMFVLCWVASYFVWDYSIVVSFIFFGFANAFLFAKKDNIPEKIVLAIIIGLVFSWMASANILTHNNQIKETNVKYDKIEYIDSTEKMIVHITEPIKKVLVISDLKSEAYFTVKGRQDINVSILYQPNSDLYDYVDDEITDHDYYFKFKDGDLEWKSSVPVTKNEKWF